MEFDTTKIKQNELSEAGETQYFVVVERKVMVQSITFQDSLIDIKLLFCFGHNIST